MTTGSLASLLTVGILVTLSHSQPAPLNPNVGVNAQCYYHGIIGSLVLECTNNDRVPNCGNSVNQQCDCNKPLQNGIDTIFVLDQLPYSSTNIGGKTTSTSLWNSYLTVLGSVLRPILDTSSHDNFVGVIRPTLNGCHLFGFSESQVLQPASSFTTNPETTYGYVDTGPCIPNTDATVPNMACAREQVQHLDCVDMARTILQAGPAGRNPTDRRKNIISLRHSPGKPMSSGRVIQNEPAIHLGYLFITTANAFDTSDRNIRLLPTNFKQSEFDYGGFDRANADFILATSSTSVVGTLLASNPSGFRSCADSTLVSQLGAFLLPEAFAEIASMTCTLWPRGPRLTWVALPLNGVGVVKGTTPVVTSWLCQLTPPPQVIPGCQPGNVVTPQKAVFQSSTGYGGPAVGAIDGNTNGFYLADYSCSHTLFDVNPWWVVDLGASASVCSVTITNRQDCCASRLNNFDIFVTNTAPTAGFKASASELCVGNQPTFSNTQTFTCGSVKTGRFVGVQIRGTQWLTLCEVQVHTTTGAPVVEVTESQNFAQMSTNPAVFNPSTVALISVSGCLVGFAVAFAMCWRRGIFPKLNAPQVETDGASLPLLLA